MNIADEVKQRLDIVSVISDYVRLEKSGRNVKGLCPFHTEKTPSFFVFPERQSWRCFGCGAGGDLISFVMKKEGLDFGEALKTLAQRAGVALPQRKDKAFEDERSGRLYRINEAAAQYYHQLLLTSSAAQGARKYVEDRGLTAKTAEEFLLGFSLNEWEGLKQHLKKQGYSESDLVTAGLAIEKESRTYDRFRGRLMFAIRNAKGQVVGFGARALDDSLPKYLNSAESPIFDKSSILYGIDRSKGAIREQGKVIIVEGYMDALTAHQNGFRNVVASMGTALTEKQIAMLKGLTTHICLSLDPDAAGDAATLRGIEVCRQALDRGARETPNWLGGPYELHAEINIISLPRGRDPDQVIRESPEEWQSLVKGAQPLMDYLFEVAAKKFDLARPEGKSQVSEQLLPLIAEMKDSVEREVYLGKLSRLVGLSEKTLVGMAARLHKTKSEKAKKRGADVLRPIPQTGDQLEEYCLCLLLKYPPLRNMAENLTPDHFEHSENREVFVAWQSSQAADEIWENLDAALHEYLQALINRQRPPLDKKEQEQALADCIRRMEERRLRAALETERDVEKNKAKLKELWHQHGSLGWR
ncbi:MAG: DNA primase [Chloroflexi bacterium CG07_land_8_20_14_0_80_51_10]|nr:MAG: DNA primase [Chloroflexi bacterium CG07_land_8_20_14_0_80_51_10]